MTFACDRDEGHSEGPLGASGDDGKADIDEGPGFEVESFEVRPHLSRAFGSWDTRNGVSPWDQFTRRAESGGNAECGNVHWPPNTLTEYAYWDTAEEVSGCDRWLDYPEHEELEPEIVNCWTWGCSGDTQLNYMQWWIQHLPRREGTLAGFETNWQRYIFDYRSFM